MHVLFSSDVEYRYFAWKCELFMRATGAIAPIHVFHNGTLSFGGHFVQDGHLGARTDAH